jgi:hypothetical protein
MVSNNISHHLPPCQNISRAVGEDPIPGTNSTQDYLLPFIFIYLTIHRTPPHQQDASGRAPPDLLLAESEVGSWISDCSETRRE